MRLLHHEEIIIPLPPGWKVDPSSQPTPTYEASSQSIASAPSLTGQVRPTLVVTSEKILSFETVETFARRQLDQLQRALGGLQILEEASVAHAYLSVYRREYEFSTGYQSTPRLRQIQYYVLVNHKVYSLTFTNAKEQSSDTKAFAQVMIARLRIAKGASNTKKPKVHVGLQVAPQKELVDARPSQEVRETHEDPALTEAALQPADAETALVAATVGPKPTAAPARSRQVSTAMNPNDPATWGDVPRNALCPCGSGKKFKHCHGRLS